MKRLVDVIRVQSLTGPSSKINRSLHIPGNIYLGKTDGVAEATQQVTYLCAVDESTALLIAQTYCSTCALFAPKPFETETGC